MNRPRHYPFSASERAASSMSARKPKSPQASNRGDRASARSSRRASPSPALAAAKGSVRGSTARRPASTRPTAWRASSASFRTPKARMRADAAEACGLGATALPVRHRRDVETNYSVVYESHFFLCLSSFVCATLSGLVRARSVWSRRQDRLRVLDICPAVERAAQARERLVVVPPANVIVLRHELPHVVREPALEPEQSFS